MFSFGQFTHLLPYLILAITSFAGLTTYHIAFFNQLKDPEESQEKIIDSDEISIFASGSIHFYDEFIEDLQDNSICSFTLDDRFLLSLLDYLLPGCNKALTQQLIPGYLFQRPPPSVFFA
jgi:hypothetical protein